VLPHLTGCTIPESFCGHDFSGAGCTQHVAAHPDAPVIPVMAAKAEEKAMPIELHEIGTAEAYSTVSIESQVAGIVSAVDYTQGQFVKKGDLLVSLDDRPFVAALEVARANLAKDRANAQLAKVEAERYEQLFQSGVVPNEQLDQQMASAAAQKSAVEADEAAVKTAELNVSYLLDLCAHRRANGEPVGLSGNGCKGQRRARVGGDQSHFPDLRGLFRAAARFRGPLPILSQ